MSVTSRPPSPPPGMRVGNYELLARLGEGGMGVVHLARGADGRRVALKVIRPNVVGDDESRARLAREVNSLSRVRSPRVAEVLDADPWGPVPYVATRYVPGWSLHDLVAQQGPQEADDLAWTAHCLAEALRAVHDAGVLHRDVKPSNVLMEGRSPVLIDFGLARVADDDRLTAQGWLLGTPGYLAPEILLGHDASAASDVHSWGATVAYAGTGRAPFGRGPSAAVMDRVRRGEHDLTGLPDDLRELVEAALDPEPRNRPTLAAAMTWLSEGTDTVVAHRAMPTVALDDDFLVVPETRPHTDDPVWWGSLPPAPDPQPQVASTRRMQVAPDEAWDQTWDEEPARAAAADRSGAGWEDAVQVLDPRDAWSEPEHAAGLAPTDSGHRPAHHRDAGASGYPEPVAHAPARPGLGARLRRSVLLLALAALVGMATSVAPYATGLLLLLAVWVLRAGSLTGAAGAERRRLRGSRWYDPVRTCLSVPYHLVASVPGTLALALWAAGLGTVTALVCFAVDTAQPVGLAATGATVAVGLWLGPGAGRVRHPLGRVVGPAATRGWTWALALLLVLGLGWALAGQTLRGSSEVDWSPGSDSPFPLELPSFVPGS